MAFTKNQLLQFIGSVIDAAQASPNKRAMDISMQADAKYKVIVELGEEDRLIVTRRKVN